MINGVNIKDDLNNTQLENQIEVNGIVTNPVHNPYKKIDANLLIDETAISNEAINLYQKEQDIKHFNTLAMSDPEDLSHEEIVSTLFRKGVSDPLSDEAAGELANNQRLLNDLSF